MVNHGRRPPRRTGFADAAAESPPCPAPDRRRPGAALHVPYVPLFPGPSPGVTGVCLSRRALVESGQTPRPQRKSERPLTNTHSHNANASHPFSLSSPSFFCPLPCAAPQFPHPPFLPHALLFLHETTATAPHPQRLARERRRSRRGESVGAGALTRNARAEASASVARSRRFRRPRRGAARRRWRRRRTGRRLAWDGWGHLRASGERATPGASRRR